MYPRIKFYIFAVMSNKNSISLRAEEMRTCPPPICLHDCVSCRNTMTSPVVIRRDLVKQATKASPKAKTFSVSCHRVEQNILTWSS